MAITRLLDNKTYEILWHYRMKHVHGDTPHPKYSQTFGSAENNQGLNHELLPKYQVQTFGHAGPHGCSIEPFLYLSYPIQIDRNISHKCVDA